MQKKLLVFLTLCISCLYGSTTLYPTFDNNREYWIKYIDNGVPIEVDSPAFLGLTTPSRGETSYNFKFEVVLDSLIFGIPSYIDNDCSLSYIDINTLVLEGSFNGPGNPLMGLPMTGNGIVNIYEKEYETYNYLGTFTVGNPIPEPCSIILLSSGVLALILPFKKTKI
jgi:hypothetical protein